MWVDHDFIPVQGPVKKFQVPVPEGYDRKTNWRFRGLVDDSGKSAEKAPSSVSSRCCFGAIRFAGDIPALGEAFRLHIRTFMESRQAGSSCQGIRSGWTMRHPKSWRRVTRMCKPCFLRNRWKEGVR